MKTQFVFVALLVVSLQSFTQIQILSEKELHEKGLTVEGLEKKYGEIRETKNQQTDSKSMGEAWESIFKFSMGLFPTELEGQQMFVNYFVSPPGKFDYVVFAPLENENKDKVLQKKIQVFKDSIHRFLSNYQWIKPLTHSTNFSVLFSFGSRKIHSGDSTICFLEQAQQTQRPDSIKHLDFNQLQLKTVPDVVYRFQNLESLNLSSNQLTVFKFDFSKFPKLKSLNLSKNQLFDFQLIEANSSIENIDLSQNKLQKAGFDVALLPKLAMLNLSKNQLTNNDLYFSEGKNLKILNIQHNKFTSIPNIIKANQKLESLWLGGNDLSNLTDDSFVGLKHLKDLNLYQCNLINVPEGIRKLKKLEILDLYYNKLTVLPESLKKLKKLQQLAIAYNEIGVLPKKINRNRKLNTIYAHHNRLSVLPKKISKLRSLKLLDLNHNWFSVFPEEVTKISALEELEISHNNLTELSPNLLTIKNLQKIFISNNPLTANKNSLLDLEQSFEKKKGRKTEIFH